MIENLKWGGIDYQKFQKLCIPLSNALYPNRKFKEYLKSGQRQHGIDLKSLELSNEPQIYIQCKNEKDFNTISKLKEAIKEFTDGIFCTRGAYFTILTSADQRKKKLQEWIHQEKTRLKDEYGIIFDCCDVNDLQEELKNHWRLVHRYFSRNEAEDFCNARFDLDIVERLAPVLNMMPRLLIERPTSQKDQKLTLHELFWSATTARKFTLASILATDAPMHQYCILGDPYHGKSTYLKQAAYELGTGDAKLLPIFIELKNANIQSIEKILDDEVGAGWREKANLDIILMLDGADELPDDRIDEIIKFIRSFSQSYPETKIVVSCRTRHFKDFKIDETLSHFKILELAQLESEEIQAYLRDRLSAKAKTFTKQALASGLSAWLFHPFYLMTLIEEFERSEQLPSSPLEAIKKFLERAYEKAFSRRLAGGRYLDHQPAQFRRLINDFAMALQISGKNAFSPSDLDELFPETGDKELLRNNPLIVEVKGQWSFTNAFLQEHLAASVLASMDFDDIPPIVWADNTTKKIKTKWLQTLSSAISLLPNTDPTRQNIIELMEQDSPELIFETESSSYPDKSFKLAALQKLMSYMLANNMWPLRTRPEKIGRFMDGTPGAARFLIDQFLHPATPDDKKEYCLRILQSLSLSAKEKKEILTITLEYLKTPTNQNISYELIGVLSSHKIGDRAAIATVLSRPIINKDHFFRCRVYEWVCRVDLTTEFWSYAIEGLPIWVEANRSTSHGGSDYPLVDLLLEVSTLEQVDTLFKALRSPALLKFSKLPGPSTYPFFTALFDKCAEIFHNGGGKPAAEILIPISQFAKAVWREYQHENYPEIDRFLEKTQTRVAVGTLLMDDIMVEERWWPGPIVEEQLFDIYFAEFKAKNLDPAVLTNVAMAIYPKDVGSLKREFAIRANAAAGTDILPVFDQAENDRQWEAESERSKNNLRTIRSRAEFRRAIRRYFKLRKTPLKDIHDVFETLDYTSPIYNARTRLVQEFLRQFFNAGTRPNLKICLDNLNSDDNFEYFRVTQLMEHMPTEPDLNKQAIDIIRQFYDKKLPSCNFENTFWTSGGVYYWKPIEDLIGRIFQQFGFSTPAQYLPELLWLDRFGVRSPELQFNKTESTLHKKIEEPLGGADKARPILSKAIINHLKTGIQLEAVLFAHFSIAARLKLEGALPFLKDAIYSKRMDDAKTEDLCKFYVLAGGDKEDLLPLLKASSPDDYYFLYLVRELGPVCNEEVKTECVKHLSDPTVIKNKAHIARELVTLGSLEGLQFLSTHLKGNSEAVAMMQLDPEVIRLDTAATLMILFDIADILVDPRYDVTRPPSARHVLRGWLNALSTKSTADLLLVKEFIEKVDKELKHRFPGPSESKWHVERILEHSRTKTDGYMEIAQVRGFLRRLEAPR